MITGNEPVLQPLAARVIRDKQRLHELSLPEAGLRLPDYWAGVLHGLGAKPTVTTLTNGDSAWFWGMFYGVRLFSDVIDESTFPSQMDGMDIHQ
jgi:hypothetical protein